MLPWSSMTDDRALQEFIPSKPLTDISKAFARESLRRNGKPLVEEPAPEMEDAMSKETSSPGRGDRRGRRVRRPKAKVGETVPSEPRYLTIREFAARLRVREETVRTWKTEGMPVFHVGRRIVRVPVAEAERWLAERAERARAVGRGAPFVKTEVIQ